MTTPSSTATSVPASDPPAARPRRSRRERPVRRFAGLCMLAVLALAGIRWTGAANPWVDLQATSYGNRLEVEGGAHLSYAGVVVHNRGLLPVDVRAVELVRPELTGARVFVRRKGADLDARSYAVSDVGTRPMGPDLAPTDGFRLDPGEEREVVVLYRDPCVRPNSGLIRLDVESVLGRHRSLDTTEVGGTGVVDDLGSTDLVGDQAC